MKDRKEKTAMNRNERGSVFLIELTNSSFFEAFSCLNQIVTGPFAFCSAFFIKGHSLLLSHTDSVSWCYYCLAGLMSSVVRKTGSKGKRLFFNWHSLLNARKKKTSLSLLIPFST